MLLERVSNPGPPTYESGALPIALCGLASATEIRVKSMVQALKVFLHRLVQRCKVL